MIKAETQGHIEVLNKIKSEYAADCSDCDDCGDCDDKSICFDFSAIQALNLAIEELEQNTVSEETYTQEFNLRKTLEMKVFELERKLAEQELSEDCISREGLYEE